MENASKALIMAAGLLVSLLIISLAVFLYSDFSDKIRLQNEELEQEEISKFNGKYFAYKNQENLSYYDIINIYKMAKQDQKKYEIAPITVKINGNEISGDLNTSSTDDVFNTGSDANYMKNGSVSVSGSGGLTPVTLLKKYRCYAIGIDTQTGRVNYIEFHSI